MKSFCGIMSGLRITPTERFGPVRALVGLAEDGERVLSVGTGAVLAKLTYQRLPVFLSAGKTIVDLETELETGIFDLRDYLSPALPIVLYIRWAFPETAWHSPEINACLVIDDPVLKRSHGFVDFAQLLSLMKRHRFSTNIAFIPWNWRRSDPKVARLFAENPELYSLSVHGCDHTHAEFGGGDRQQLDSRIRRAIRRMDHHEERTGIRHDRVMVFPQGVFSTEAMTALKRSELIAAVNNDTISADPRPSPVTIADVWQVALMNYGNFALFTRRYPWEGLENFAFDALLGKPAIIIVHHDSCRDDCKALTEFVDRFNSLESAPAWRSLGEVVRRSCRQRQISEDAVEVTMYASELRLENRSNQPKRFQLQRTEPAVSSIARITRDSEPLAWSGSEGRIFGELELDAGEAARIRIEFQSSEDEREEETDIVYEARTMLRRYVCEARDNYLTKYKLMLKSALGANRENWN
jgi:hypothetical protein